VFSAELVKRDGPQQQLHFIGLVNCIMKALITRYVIGDRFSHQAGWAPKKTEICGIICELLGLLEHSKPVTENLLVHEEIERFEPQIIMCIG